MKIRNVLFSILIILLLALVIWTLWGNTALEVNTYTVCSDRLPSAFSGFRIAQISDLHNTEFGNENEKLLALLRQSQPDIIVITGDIACSYKTNIDISIRFAHEAVKIAPCYYVTGNHESRLAECGELLAELEAAGVTVLRNRHISLEHGGASITLAGLDDPTFDQSGKIVEVMSAVMERATEDGSCCVLLSHRPEYFDFYAQCGVDLVFTGHAHGGQFRLPFIGGVIAPGQGYFPQYDSGFYTADSTTMMVSRGIGNSIIPIRFNNRPEIVVVELSTAS